MNAEDVFDGSDGAVTRKYYADLEKLGPMGLVAMNLFRAQKCSARAKVYRGGIRGRGSYKSMAYERKSWSMAQLCEILAKHGAELGIGYGWKEDQDVVFGLESSWVLYVDLPIGQVSFHSPTRGIGPAYKGEWDAEHVSESRILQFCNLVMSDEILVLQRLPNVRCILSPVQKELNYEPAE